MRKIEGDSDGLLHILLYRFKSTKSNLTYFVQVEKFKNNVYAVKFYLKNHSSSKNKYRLKSNTYEPRRIINTCINIMLEIYENDPRASFGFIGATDMDEKDSYCTKRYRIYSRIIATYFSDKKFFHKENKRKSAYILINRNELNANPELPKEIEDFFVGRYEYFS